MTFLKDVPRKGEHIEQALLQQQQMDRGQFMNQDENGTDEDNSDEEPDVDDIDVSNEKLESGVNDNISELMKTMDEETCLEMLKSYYSVFYEQELPERCRIELQGCEYDNSSQTYRIQATLSVDTANIGIHYLVIRMDHLEGNPKVLSIK